ncbi:MAG TPA: glycoside hydrolase family 16 protein [Actinophytocola sp.]|nr:glycoside hydrolase family 16 protein [Actinophytocola sp.]
MATAMIPPAAADTSESDARKVRVQLAVPQTVDADTARLRGKVTGRDAVVIQRHAFGKDRWIRVKRVSANRHGLFRTTVPKIHRLQRFRAVAMGRKSITRPVPAASNLTDACGRRPLKGDGSLWSCTLAENFSGTELDRSVWMPQTIFRSGSASAWACYIDDPSVLSVHGGALHLTVRELAEPQPCAGRQNEPTPYVAGSVSTYRLFSQRYGRFEARISNTATTAPGLQEAFWLWPDDRYNTAIWPAAGEIDIAETYSNHPELAIPFLHYTENDNGGPQPGLNTAWDCAAERGEYNTYTLEWTATRLKILVNGKTCLVNTSGDPAFKKPYIVALTQMLGVGRNTYDGRAPLPATMTIDYVKVWR